MRNFKVCFLALQVHGLGKIGGFGSMTVQLSSGLRQCSVQTYIVLLKKSGRTQVNRVHGVPVVSVSLLNILGLIKVFKRINLDIFHSQNPSILTLFAQLVLPQKAHIVTCRDPRDLKDWLNEFRNATWIRRVKIPINYLTEESWPIRWSVRRANLVGCPAHFLRKKAKKIYKLRDEPIFLPNLEKIPDKIPIKSTTPTVCFVGRLEKRKRPERFIELARKFPEVKFILVGESEERRRSDWLNAKARNLKNLERVGFLNKFRDPGLYSILDSCQILVNTSTREGLPLTFIEAAGRGCAILSSTNPDDFASEFGYWAQNDDFEFGLKRLLENDNWRKSGVAGHKYVYQNYRFDQSLEQHLFYYNRVLHDQTSGY